jgi:general secretion pathway protein C
MLQRLVTLAVWLIVGWTAMALLLRLLPGGQPLPAGVQALASEAPPPADLTRLFGAPVSDEPQAAPPPPPESARFKLLGVVAPRQAGEQTRQGVALMSIDGGPARAFRIGQLVDGEFRLLSVSARGAGLGAQGQVSLQLPLSELPPAATGMLPGMGMPLVQGMSPPLQQPSMPPMESPQGQPEPDAEPDEGPGPRRPRPISPPQAR